MGKKIITETVETDDLNQDNEYVNDAYVDDGKGAFRITYLQGDENIELTFFDVERRDHEYARLVAAGIAGLAKVDV